MKTNNEIYVSVDIEADGRIPGDNSMLSFGAVAYDASGLEIDFYYATLDTLEGATSDPDTMAWWGRQDPTVWEAAREGARPASIVMPEFNGWVDKLPGKPVFVGFPATFDFLFVYWYLIKFAGRSPFGFSALDIKSLAMGELGTAFRKTVKRRMPRRWFVGAPKHTHHALDDARGQGILLSHILKDIHKRHNPPSSDKSSGAS